MLDMLINCSKAITKDLSLHLKCVATLPCKMLMSENWSDNLKQIL